MGFRPFYNSAEKKLADDNMKQLGIESLAKHCYRELSGGQQQRVLLARALCAASKMLLLDEPVTGLDPLAQTELYELIAKLKTVQFHVLMQENLFVQVFAEEDSLYLLRKILHTI